MTNRNAASMGTYGSTWESRGYCGRGPSGSLIGTLEGRPAVVCGSSETVFNELEDVMDKLETEPVIFGVNDTGMFLPTMDHWVSLHADHLGAWKAVRWLHSRPQEHTRYHSVDSRPFIDHVWEGLTPLMALSGYFAMQIAYVMGASPIVLCGCPGDRAARFFEARPRTDFSYGAGRNGNDNSVRTQVEHEMKRLPEFKARVRSMGGWTGKFFGGL